MFSRESNADVDDVVVDNNDLVADIRAIRQMLIHITSGPNQFVCESMKSSSKSDYISFQGCARFRVKISAQKFHNLLTLLKWSWISDFVLAQMEDQHNSTTMFV